MANDNSDVPMEKLWGVLAQFETPGEVFHACEKVRDAGYGRWDAHTPFPVHGLDDAMGLKPTILPWIVFIMAMIGASSGMTMQWWMKRRRLPSRHRWQTILLVASLHSGDVRAVGSFRSSRVPLGHASP